jgi:hypothetical protein
VPTAKKKTTKEIDLRSLARGYTDVCVRRLGGWATAKPDAEGNPTVDPEIQIRAIGMLLDRGWGKPNQPVTGEDGGDIKFTIRTIIEGTKK